MGKDVGFTASWEVDGVGSLEQLHRRFVENRRLVGLGVWISALTSVGALVGSGAAEAALPPECAPAARDVVCTYVSGSNAFTVPAGVASVGVKAIGGTGGSPGSGSGASGGRGAVVFGTLPVTAGSTLYAVVGGNAAGITAGVNGGGAGGRIVNASICTAPNAPAACLTLNSGGGGGESDVRTSQSDLSTRLLVAAGGGGAGGIATGAASSPGGAGGAAGGTGIGADGGPGLSASSSSGGAGGAAGSASFLSDPTCALNACAPGQAGTPGALGLGGAGGAGGAEIGAGPTITVGSGGGGGGGGLYGGGGGGGGGILAGGGGGGGSNLVPSGGSQSLDTTGVPMVQISYKLVPTTIGQCLHGHWRDFPQFKNQGDCVSFVETGK